GTSGARHGNDNDDEDCAGHRNDEDDVGHANHGDVHANDDGNSGHVDADTNKFAASETEKKSANKEDKEKDDMEKNAEQKAAKKEVATKKEQAEKLTRKLLKRKKAEMEKAEAKKKEEAKKEADGKEKAKKKAARHKKAKKKKSPAKKGASAKSNEAETAAEKGNEESNAATVSKTFECPKVQEKMFGKGQDSVEKSRAKMISKPSMYLKSPFMNKMVKTQDKLDEDEIIYARSIFCMQGDIRIRTAGKDMRRHYFPTNVVTTHLLNEEKDEAKEGLMSEYANKFGKDNKEEEKVKKMVEDVIKKRIAEDA
ncbi:hypothetical protein Tco_0754948, partial [Tanacetum coccineum]